MKHALIRLQEERRALLHQLEDCRANMEHDTGDIVPPARLLAQTEQELRDVDRAIELIQSRDVG